MQGGEHVPDDGGEVGAVAGGPGAAVAMGLIRDIKSNVAHGFSVGMGGIPMPQVFSVRRRGEIFCKGAADGAGMAADWGFLYNSL